MVVGIVLSIVVEIAVGIVVCIVVISPQSKIPFVKRQHL